MTKVSEIFKLRCQVDRLTAVLEAERQVIEGLRDYINTLKKELHFYRDRAKSSPTNSSKGKLRVLIPLNHSSNTNQLLGNGTD